MLRADFGSAQEISFGHDSDHGFVFHNGHSADSLLHHRARQLGHSSIGSNRHHRMAHDVGCVHRILQLARNRRVQYAAHDRVPPLTWINMRHARRTRGFSADHVRHFTRVKGPHHKSPESDIL